MLLKSYQMPADFFEGSTTGLEIFIDGMYSVMSFDDEKPDTLWFQSRTRVTTREDGGLITLPQGDTVFIAIMLNGRSRPLILFNEERQLVTRSLVPIKKVLEREGRINIEESVIYVNEETGEILGHTTKKTNIETEGLNVMIIDPSEFLVKFRELAKSAIKTEVILAHENRVDHIPQENKNTRH